jgi:hypothetical protein
MRCATDIWNKETLKQLTEFCELFLVAAHRVTLWYRAAISKDMGPEGRFSALVRGALKDPISDMLIVTER